MVEARMTKAVANENSKTCFGSLRIVKGVDRLIYIRILTWRKEIDNNSIKHTIYVQIYLRIPIDLLDLEVKP